MKYIGSGLWALASVYLFVGGHRYDAAFFAIIAILIMVIGSNKGLVTVNNFVNRGE